MTLTQPRRRLRSSCLLLPGILAGASSCRHWVTQTAPVAVVVSDHPSSHLRVDPCSGDRFELFKSQLVGDTLVGNLWGPTPVERRFPTDSVCAFATRKVSPPRTILLGVGIGLVVALAVSLDDIAAAGAASGGGH